MASVVDGMDLSAVHGSRYPWDEWLDGQTWELIPDVDFDCSPENMRAQVHVTSKKRGHKTITRIRDERLYIQAVVADD